MTARPEQLTVEVAMAGIREVALAVSAGLDMPSIVVAIAEGLKTLPGTPSITVGVSHHGDGPLRLIALEGFRPGTYERWGTIDLDTPVPLTEVLRTGETLFFASRDEILAKYPILRDEIMASDHNAWVALPLVTDVGNNGVVGLAWPSERRFTQLERLFLFTLSKLGGEALRRASREVDRHHLAVLLADASETLRTELARDLHDQSVQRLATASMRIGSLRIERPQLDGPGIDAILADVEGDVRAVITSLRDLIVGLNPPDLGNLDLTDAVHDLIDWMFDASTDVRVTDRVGLSMHEASAQVVYRVVAEALSNAGRHAEATAIDVQLSTTDMSMLVLTIEDDGKGMTRPLDRARAGHLGLQTARERVEDVGGSLRIESDDGVRITATLPRNIALPPRD